VKEGAAVSGTVPETTQPGFRRGGIWPHFREGLLMLALDIPGKGKIVIKHVILDFNGTLAADGKLIPGVVSRLEALSSLVAVHVITADTNASARSELATIPCTLKIIGHEQQDRAKLEYADALGPGNVLAVGNGRNDVLLLEKAALGICVVQLEGAAVISMQAADMVCVDINDALDLLLRSHRMTATLRN
jgi:soluble P-type ATPase